MQNSATTSGCCSGYAQWNVPISDPPVYVRFGSSADTAASISDVCYCPEADIAPTAFMSTRPSVMGPEVLPIVNQKSIWSAPIGNIPPGFANRIFSQP